MGALQLAPPVEFGDERIPCRLWAKVVVDPKTGCWMWTGKRDGSEGTYGGAWYEGRNHRVSRLFYVLLVRRVEDAEHVHHDCRNRRCVNPAHMDAVPQEEHWGHGHRDKTHCPHGHEYTLENTKRTPFLRLDGSPGYRRNCRTCARERAQGNPYRKKAHRCT